MPILKPYKLVSKESQPEPARVCVGRETCVGGDTVSVIAGPCTVEGREMLLEAAHAVKESGAAMLRGGAFKTADVAV